MSYKILEANELEPIGEKLESGELFLDGTKDYISSEGREPVEAVVEYVPALRNIDGIDYESSELKWSGKGTYGFFGEYENVGNGELTTNNATITIEGSWTKLEATSTEQGNAQTNFTALSTNAYFEVLVRKGNTAISVVSLNTSSARIGTCSITWGNPTTFAFDDGGVDAGTSLITNDIVKVRLHAGTTGAVLMYIRTSEFSSVVGEYTYYKDWMVVDLDYPVPYTEGVHQVNKLQYNIDWAESDTWTIEGWFNADSQNVRQYLITTRPSPATIFEEIRFDDTGELRLWTKSSSGESSLDLTGYVSGQWNYIKVILNGTSIRISLNGAAFQEKTTDINTLEDMAKNYMLGSLNTSNEALLGYLSDFRLLKGEDTSTTHYNSGLPYYNPNKTYGKNASWSIDQRGNISGIPQETGRIIEEYELDGQHVTKWDTGRMEIITHRSIADASITIAIGNDYRSGNLVLNFVESFKELISAQNTMQITEYHAYSVANRILTIDSLTYEAYSTASLSSINIISSILAIGRWK